MAVMRLRNPDGTFREVPALVGPPGSPGEPGEAGEPGYTPVRGTDYWTETDKAEIIEDASAQLEGVCVKMAQGAAHVGKILVVGADGNLTLTDVPTATGDVVGVLDDNNNIVITGSLADGTYTFRYENSDGTYAEIGSLTVANGGTDSGYTNLADTSEAAGWLNDKRFSTSDASVESLRDATGAVITNYIQVHIGQVLRARGLDFVNTGTVTPCAARYNANKEFVQLTYLNANNGGSYDAATSTSMITISNFMGDGEYLRISCVLADGYTADDVIITLDAEITD